MNVFEKIREKLEESNGVYIDDAIEIVNQVEAEYDVGNNGRTTNMSRLTARFDNGQAFIIPSIASQPTAMKMVIDRLAEYEDAGMDGRLNWIDVDIEVPSDDRLVLLSFDNYPVPAIGRYIGDEDNGGAFYLGDEDATCLSYDLIVNGWMELPKQYKGV